MCWNVRSEGSGGKGIDFQLNSNDNDLLDALVLSDVGWVGAGRARVCMEADDWELLDQEQTYTFEVEGTSNLFGTTTTSSFSFVLSSSSSRSITSPRQGSSCDPSLWDASPSSLYGIQTYPSGNTLFPSSLRSYSMPITAKALSPCSEIGMAKDILAPSVFSWEFVGSVPDGLDGVDLNNWANGTRLVIPSDVLLDREAFPPNELVRIRVNADFGNDIEFVSDMGIEFAPSPVEMVVDSSFQSIMESDEVLVIDFEDSYTLDGIDLDDDIWEWDWSCVIPGERGEQSRECVYEDGDVVVMPGETQWRFEGEQGKELEEGVPLFFSVRSRVRETLGGEVIAEGSWSSIVNPVGEEASGLELIEDSWVCFDSSVGFVVIFSFCCFFVGNFGVYLCFLSSSLLGVHFASMVDSCNFRLNFFLMKTPPLNHHRLCHFGLRFVFFGGRRGRE